MTSVYKYEMVMSLEALSLKCSRNKDSGLVLSNALVHLARYW